MEVVAQYSGTRMDTRVVTVATGGYRVQYEFSKRNNSWRFSWNNRTNGIHIYNELGNARAAARRLLKANN